MKRLLYGRTLQFSIGSFARDELENSEVALARQRKTKCVETVRKEMAGKDELLLLLLDHLREHLDPGAWYTLPIEVMEALSMQKLDTALTSGLSISVPLALTAPLYCRSPSMALVLVFRPFKTWNPCNWNCKLRLQTGWPVDRIHAVPADMRILSSGRGWVGLGPFESLGQVHLNLQLDCSICSGLGLSTASWLSC